MNSVEVYAVTIGGILCILLAVNAFSWVARAVRFLSPLVLKHLFYRYVLHRHRFLGPWSRAGVLLQLIYIAGNVTCVSLGASQPQEQSSSLTRAGLRAGTLSIVNLIPVLASPSLDYLADLLGIPLSSARLIHRSAGLMAVSLAVFHTLVAVESRSPFALDQPQNLFAVIAGISLVSLSSCFLPIFRRLSYEISLRLHQMLSVILIYGIWRHLSPEYSFPRYSLYAVVGLFALLFSVQSILVLYRNGIFRAGHAQADLSECYGAIRLHLQCGKPLHIKTGQYISLWIPSASFWTFAQTHPFTVISWSEKPQSHLELFIEPRGGLTQKLLRRARQGKNTHSPVLYSGPHGKSVCMDSYEKILMVASDFGIAAMLPYIKQLIHGYNTRQLCAQRVHVVWQVRDISAAISAETLLNIALNEDTIDDGWILTISIYCESNDVPRKSFGKRANIYVGKAPVRDLFEAELSGESIKKSGQNMLNVFDRSELESGGMCKRDDKLLVTVSAADDMRTELRNAARDLLGDKVKFFQLDHQPSQT